MLNKRIIFLGGIHGVGKGVLCSEIESKYPVQYLSASELLKWYDLNKDKENKLVDDIESNQSKLLNALNAKCRNDICYLLDGHYCLLNKESIPTKIDKSIFLAINPMALTIKVEKPTIIQQRLEKRDGKKYSLGLISKMQTMELEHAKYIASVMARPFYQIDIDNYNPLFEKLTGELQ